MAQGANQNFVQASLFPNVFAIDACLQGERIGILRADSLNMLGDLFDRRLAASMDSNTLPVPGIFGWSVVYRPIERKGVGNQFLCDPWMVSSVANLNYGVLNNDQLFAQYCFLCSHLGFVPAQIAYTKGYSRGEFYNPYVSVFSTSGEVITAKYSSEEEGLFYYSKQARDGELVDISRWVAVPHTFGDYNELPDTLRGEILLLELCLLGIRGNELQHSYTE